MYEADPVDPCAKMMVHSDMSVHTEYYVGVNVDFRSKAPVRSKWSKHRC
jgi:succinyl-CoA synthetase beta subunit